MVRTLFRKLGTDLRFQVAFLLLVVLLSVVVGLVTERVVTGFMVLNVFSIVVGGAKYREERSASP